MTLLNAAAETDVWLVDYLEADPELSSLVSGVFSTFIGYSNDPLPVVRFFLVEQDDLMTNNATRVWSEFVYQVEAITNGPDATEARAISQRVDELLHRLRGETSSTVLVQEVFRRAPLFRRTKEGGDEYIYAGGEYVMRVTAL
jgi:hypothetical protein